MLGGEPRQEPLLDLVAAPAQQRVDDQRVLDVDEDADRRVDARQLLDGQHRVEERAAGAAVALRHLDAHDAELEQLRRRASRGIFACSSISRTSGRTCASANSRTLSRKIASSSASTVSGCA